MTLSLQLAAAEESQQVQASRLQAVEEAQQQKERMLMEELRVPAEEKEPTKLTVSEQHTKLAVYEAIIEQQKARIGDLSDSARMPCATCLALLAVQRFAPQPRQFSIATPPHFEGATVCGPSIKTLSGSFERGPSSLAPSDWTQGESPASRPPAFDYSGAAHCALAPPPPPPPVLSSCGPAATEGRGQPTASCAQGAVSPSSAACSASPEVQKASECMAGGAHSDDPMIAALDGRTTPRWFLMQEDGDGDTVSDCTVLEGRTGTGNQKAIAALEQDAHSAM